MFLCSADDMSSGRGADDTSSRRGADDNVIWKGCRWTHHPEGVRITYSP